MIRRVTWRFWAGIVLGCAAYGLIGWWESGRSSAELLWLYRIGLTAATFVPLLFTVVYTALGAKWWRNEIGASIVLAAISLIPIVLPLATALWFYNGVVSPSWLVWLEVSGPALAALAWLRLCWVWLRIGKDKRPPIGGL